MIQFVQSNQFHKNAFASIRDNLEPHSTEIEESELHDEKHPKHKNSIDAGIMISIKPVS
jgi:hypothetical protein